MTPSQHPARPTRHRSASGPRPFRTSLPSPPLSGRPALPTHLVGGQHAHEPQLVRNSSEHAVSIGLDLKDLAVQHLARVANDGNLLLALLFQLGVPSRVGRGSRLEDGLLLAGLWAVIFAVGRGGRGRRGRRGRGRCGSVPDKVEGVQNAGQVVEIRKSHHGGRGVG